MVNNKYKERPSPPYRAKDFPDKIKKGNDGNKYMSKEDKNGIYKWIKITKEPNNIINNNKNIYIKNTANEYFKQFPNYTKPLYNTNIFTKNLKKYKIRIT